MEIGDNMRTISDLNRNGNSVNLLVNSPQKGKIQSGEGQKAKLLKMG